MHWIPKAAEEIDKEIVKLGGESHAKRMERTRKEIEDA
jgi:hypothetical protein